MKPIKVFVPSGDLDSSQRRSHTVGNKTFESFQFRFFFRFIYSTFIVSVCGRPSDLVVRNLEIMPFYKKNNNYLN